MPISQEQPVESFKVSDKDIQAFLGSKGARSSGTFNLHGLAGIKKDLYDNSLRSLRVDLASDLLSFQDLKAKYAPLLLKDIEEFSESMQHTSEMHPKFQESFKDEINKPHDKRSEEFKAFMEYYRDTGEAESSIIKVTMEMLDAFDQSSEPQEISTALNKGLKEYGEYSRVQVQKDSRRGVIILKDQDGQARIISFDDLDTLQITAEQRGFIQNAWDQRSFKGGWLSAVSDPNDLSPKINAVQGVDSNLHESAAFDNNSTDLIIDLSQKGQVKLYNKTGMGYRSFCPNRTDDREFIQAVLEVDISSLEGNSFTHGCASAEPEINFYISTFDPGVKVEFPKGLKLTESADQTRQNIAEDTIKSCIQEIAKNGDKKELALLKLNRMIKANQAELVLDIVLLDPSLSKEEKKSGLSVISKGNEETVFSDIIKSHISEMKAKEAKGVELEEKDARLLEFLPERGDYYISQLSREVEKIITPPDQLEQALAVQYYNVLEEDPQKREQFAAKQLSKYVDSLGVIKLDEKKTAEISKALIAIMEPICADEKEKGKLRGSADMLVRKCASHAGTKMSFGQAWHTYVVDPIKQLLGREGGIKSLEKYEQIAGSIKKSFTTAKPNNQLPRRGVPAKDVGGRGL
jgi:hypothetical protein